MARRTFSISCTFTAVLFLFQGLWVMTHGFVVMTPGNSAQCPDRWNHFGNKCYRIFGESQALQRATWTDANRRCEDIGATLVSIHSMEEQAYLSNYVSNAESDVWIGLHLSTNQNTFRWTDDSQLNFTYWEEGEPNNFNYEEECVHMNFEGTAIAKWNDNTCVTINPFICQIPAVICGGNIVSDRGAISSPNYPNLYARNSECLWMITVPEDRRVALRFSSFELEEEDVLHQCRYDYVRILDPHELDNTVLGKYCGQDVPEDVVSSGNKMIVQFKSDSSNQYKGFAAEFMTDFSDGCGENIVADMGVVSSPTHLGRYPPNSDCVWWITVPEGYQIILSFSSFEVEEDETNECIYDYVEVRDGHQFSSPILGKYCGTDIPENVISSGNKMRIQFKSDFSFEYRGFNAFFRKVTRSG